MKKEALFYRKLPQRAVRCQLCLRLCPIPEGQVGWCRTRQNRGGVLYSLTYGQVSSLSLNPIEKKPVYHFYPGSLWLSLGSLGCNLRCAGCQNWEIAHWTGGSLAGQYLPPATLVCRAKEAGARGISFTFNEPILSLEYALEVAPAAKEQGLLINYVTNGYMNPVAFEHLLPFLDVWRVDVKGSSLETYRRIAPVPSFREILSVTEKARKAGIHVEVVTNMIPRVNDREEEIRGIATWIRKALGPDTPWHLTRFYPHLQLSHLPPTPLSKMERAWSLAKAEGLLYPYLGNVPGHRAENTYCHSCGRLLVQRQALQVVQNLIRYGRCPCCQTLIPGRFA